MSVLLPTASVVIYEYLGYNGSFARKRIPLFMAKAIGPTGVTGNCCPSSWHGNADKHYALRDADEWSKFTGWPVVALGRVEEFDDALKG